MYSIQVIEQTFQFPQKSQRSVIKKKTKRVTLPRSSFIHRKSRKSFGCVLFKVKFEKKIQNWFDICSLMTLAFSKYHR